MANRRRVVCVGGVAVDRKYWAMAPVVLGTSNPAASELAFGGVARNIAENLARLGTPTALIGAVGQDEYGRRLLQHLELLGIDATGVAVMAGPRTAEYAAILNPSGDLVLGIADMAISDLLTPDVLGRAWSRLEEASWVVADCNLPMAALQALIERKDEAGFKLAVDVVSTLKAERLPLALHGIDLLFANADEAAVLLGLSIAQSRDDPASAASSLLDAGALNVIVSLDVQGCVVASAAGCEHLPSVAAEVVDVTGAGDAMVAGTLFALQGGTELRSAARLGSLLAALTIESRSSVRPDLSLSLLMGAMHRAPGVRLELQQWTPSFRPVS